MSGNGKVTASSSSSKSHKTSKSVVKWRRLPDLPCAMFLPQVVVTASAVYVGGGVSRHGMLDIYSYNFGSGRWSTLPCNNVMVFGMCMFQDRLMTVGGGTAQGLTNKAFSMDLSSDVQKWEEFPSMNCARIALSVVSTYDIIVALGGAVWVVGKKDPTPVSTVEVYRSKTEQWQQVSDIPYPCASMSTTIMGDVCYLMGDINPDERRKVLCLDLLQYEYSGTPSRQALESPTTIATSTTGCLSTSSPSFSPSRSHILPGKKASGHKKVTAMDNMKTMNSINSKSQPRNVPSIVITSTLSTTNQHPSHTSSDNAASAIAHRSTHERDITQATPLSHSPVNAVSSLSSNTSMSATHISTSPSHSCSSPSFSAEAMPSGHHVETFSKSMPDLDGLPKEKTPHHLYPRAAEDWYALPHPPTESGCILGINNHLVSIGGSRNGVMYQSLLIYSNRYDQWLKVAGVDIPAAVEGCSAAVLHTGEILLVGGEDSEGEYSSRVYIGSPV